MNSSHGSSMTELIAQTKKWRIKNENNKRQEESTDQLYAFRQRKGETRAQLNEAINKIPGIYNL